MSDPILKAAAEEIKATLAKYDLAAMIVLQAEKSLEFVNVISPSWSCARLNDETGELRIRAKREEFPSLEAQKRCVEATCCMILGFMNQAERNRENMTVVAEMLGRHFGISHWEQFE